MAENSKIEWCHHTFNPWTGCTKVGPGCDHCYAEGWAKRSGIVQWGPSAERRRTSEANWRNPLKWNAEAKRLGIRYRVFCASLADVFDNEVPDEWRADLFDLIARTPNLDWLLVTKRIGNVERMVMDALRTMFVRTNQEPTTWPWANVWLGITVVNQDEVGRDIPKLIQTPAAVRFLSVEPLLGPVSFRWMAAWPENKANRALNPAGGTDHLDGLRRLNWVIVGGESGPKARPMHPQWVRDIRDQCEAAGVPMMLKQWGEWKPISQMDESEHGGLYKSCVIAKPHENQSNLDDIYGRRCTVPSTVLHANGSTHDITEPMAFMQGTEAMQIFRIGKKTAGRLLDGVLHDGYPEAQP